MGSNPIRSFNNDCANRIGYFLALTYSLDIPVIPIYNKHMICYSDKEIATTPKGGFSLGECDATALYLTHYANFLYLSFIIRNTDDWQEKRQALKEVEIAERKMKFWQRQSSYEKTRAKEGMVSLKRQWRRDE